MSDSRSLIVVFLTAAAAVFLPAAMVPAGEEGRLFDLQWREEQAWAPQDPVAEEQWHQGQATLQYPVSHDQPQYYPVSYAEAETSPEPPSPKPPTRTQPGLPRPGVKPQPGKPKADTKDRSPPSDKEPSSSDVEAELSQLLDSPVGSYTTSPNEKLSIYGYGDITAGYNRYESGTSGFDMYHWQTYFQYRVTDNITFLGDLTLEHGPMHTATNLGDIKTRAYATIEFHRVFKLNLGKFLSPFGEYNLYHDATPVYTSVNSPRSIYWQRGIGVNTNGTVRVDRFFAKEATGAWLWGDIDLVEDLCFPCFFEKWSLEHNLYIINGRGTGNTAQIDSNADKGLGSKFVLKSPHGVSVGFSHYGDKDTRLIDSRRHHYTNAVQAIWEVGKGQTPGAAGYGEGKLKFYFEYAWANYGADGKATGYYGQVDYLFYKNLTAYYRYDRYDDLTPRVLEGDEIIHTVGVNWAVAPGVYFKIEHDFYELDPDVFQGQFALAY